MDHIPTPRVFVPNGHFYSPVPSDEDIRSAARRAIATAPPPGIDFNEAGQFALLEALAAFYPTQPFSDSGGPGLRYRFDNPSYSYADGLFLHTMIRHLRPQRVIEVGSGYTSALTLDTIEHFLGGAVETCFIEPYPELLLSLISEADRRQSRIVAARLQDVDPSLFDALRANDILFIDSTHVSKIDSDVNHLFFEILPRLAPGTMIHIHDVFPASSTRPNGSTKAGPGTSSTSSARSYSSTPASRSGCSATR